MFSRDWINTSVRDLSLSSLQENGIKKQTFIMEGRRPERIGFRTRLEQQRPAWPGNGQ